MEPAQDGDGVECPLMGWSGRAAAPPAIECWEGAPKKEHAMSQKFESAIAVIGIDIGKNSFHVVGHHERGAIVLGRSGHVAR